MKKLLKVNTINFFDKLLLSLMSMLSPAYLFFKYSINYQSPFSFQLAIVCLIMKLVVKFLVAFGLIGASTAMYCFSCQNQENGYSLTCSDSNSLEVIECPDEAQVCGMYFYKGIIAHLLLLFFLYCIDNESFFSNLFKTLVVQIWDWDA